MAAVWRSTWGVTVFLLREGQRRRCGLPVTSNQSFHGISAQGSAATAGEDRSIGLAGTLAEPFHEDPHYFSAKRSTSLLSPLSLATYVSSGPENDGLALQADEFGDPQSRLDSHQQQGMIPPSDPGCRIRPSHQRVDLLTREVFNRSPLVTLARNRQYPATQVSATWLLERHVAEKGMDGCQACIPGPGAVRTLAFKVVEEVADKVGVQFFER